MGFRGSGFGSFEVGGLAMVVLHGCCDGALYSLTLFSCTPDSFATS